MEKRDGMKRIYIFIAIVMQCAILNAMDPAIQQQIEALNVWKDQTFKSLKQENASSDTMFEFYEQYRYRLSAIVMQSMKLIPNAEKLNLLQGDCFYASRKQIIQDMLNNENVDPNTIVYQTYENPLFESVVHKDFTFAQYLWQKGARPDGATLLLMKNDSGFARLLETEK